MKWRRLFPWAVVAALAGWGWVTLHPSPERLIRKQLAGVAHAVSFGPGQGNLAKLANAARLAGYFSTNVDVQIDVRAIGNARLRVDGRHRK